MKLAWKGGLGLLVSAVLIWWTLRGVDLGEVWQVVAEGSLVLLAASIVVNTSGFLIRAARWGILLRPLKRDTSLNSRLGAVSIGFMGNNLLPARMGEFMRVYAFGRIEGISMSGVFGSLVVERFLDGLVLFAFLLLPMMLPGFPGAEAVQSGVVSVMVRGVFLALILGVLILGALLIWPARVVRLFERLARFLPAGLERRAVDALEAFLDALVVLKDPRDLVAALVWSFGFWGFHSLSFWLAMAAFGINEGLGAAIFTEAVVGFGVALPAAPGFLGTFHASANWALSGVYGADPARSLAFAYGFHLGGFIPITLIGLWYAHRFGFSLSEMGRSEEAVERAVEVTHAEVARAAGETPAVATKAGGPGAAGEAGRGERAAPGGSTSGGPALARHKTSRVVIDAPAKVNLFLHVLAREPSGYHGIQTLFQALEWGDRLLVERTGEEGVELEVEGFGVGPVEENLVVRAAKAFLSRAGAPGGARIRLEKRIPPASGLGGGSSDAASTLAALSVLYDQAMGADELLELSAGLGSDVPFFLCGSPLALGWGRGERLLPVPALPPAPVIVGLPPIAVSTREAYEALDRARGDRSRSHALPSPPVPEGMDWRRVEALAGNDFEEVVLAAHPGVREARELLAATGPRVAMLSGSGSAVFAVYHGGAAAARAFRELEAAATGTRWVLTRTRGLSTRPEVP